jgi:hypothetical protein
MANNTVRVAASITGANSGTDWLLLRGPHGYVDISVSGTFSATVTLQRKRPGEAASAARDIETFTGPAEKMIEMAGHWDVRLIVKTGAYTSGTVAAELGV